MVNLFIYLHVIFDRVRVMHSILFRKHKLRGVEWGGGCQPVNGIKPTCL